MERKKSEHIQARTDRIRLVLYPMIQLVILPTCVQNMNFLCYTVVEISLTKNIERKKEEQIQGRTSRRRLILNPMIQLAIVNLNTKY